METGCGGAAIVFGTGAGWGGVACSDTFGVGGLGDDVRNDVVPWEVGKSEQAVVK